MSYPNVRLACSECDDESNDGITTERLAEIAKEGWEYITEFQSYEDSAKTYENPSEAPPGYSVLDWFTHIGLCPDCAKEMK